jgi:hypothetical protein
VSIEYRFVVNPDESLEEREARWDVELAALHEQGLTVSGLGPDEDYPIRYEFPDGKSVNDTELPLDGPFVEVYDTKPLGFDVSHYAFRAGPEFGAALHLARQIERIQAEEMHRG